MLDKEKFVLYVYRPVFCTAFKSRDCSFRQLCLTPVSLMGGSRVHNRCPCLSHVFSPMSQAQSLIGFSLLG